MTRGSGFKRHTTTMEPDTLSLSRLRPALAHNWLMGLFGIAYLVSQATIAIILLPVRSHFMWLQCLGFTARDYTVVFRQWEETGVMSAYRAHFVLDDVHWVWYSAFVTVLLCRLFERQRVPHRYNWVLLLPLVSGLLDWYENHIQHVFLGSPDFSTIADPLPLLSTLASDMKWALAAVYVSLAVVLFLRRSTSRRLARSQRRRCSG